MIKPLVFVVALAAGLSGCGGTSVTLSGAGEVRSVVQELGWSVDKDLIKHATERMQWACEDRGWVLMPRPVPMTSPSLSNADTPLVVTAASADKHDATLISETVERVFRWFPSRSVAVSGCCVHQDDVGNPKKACPAPKKPATTNSPKYKITSSDLPESS